MKELTEYQDDPVGFCRDVLGVEPWEKQEEVLLAIRDHPRVTVRACHGVGKSFIAACACLWRLHCFRPSIVLSTAPSHRQVKDVLWRQIRRLQNRAQGDLPGEVRETMIKISEDVFATGFATDEGDRFQGFHMQNIFVVVEEASGVGDVIFEAIDGCLTNRGAKLLLIGNPLRPSGRFYRSHEVGNWRRVHISSLDSPNAVAAHLPVTLGRDWRGDPEDMEALLWPEPVKSDLVDIKWIVEQAEAWGWDSAVFRSRVLGEFPDSAADQLIALSWVEAAEKKFLAERRSLQPFDPSLLLDATGVLLDNHPAATAPSILTGEFSPATAGDAGALNLSSPAVSVASTRCEIGLDVARYGDCENVLVARRDEFVTRIEGWRGMDLMESTGRVATMLRQECAVPGTFAVVVRVDVVGLGGGLFDRLTELLRLGELPAMVSLQAFNGGERPRIRPEQYYHRRDEAYFMTRERLKAGKMAVPVDNLLRGQLTALAYSFTSSGQLKVESKEELRGRGERSPDRADALVLAFLPEGRPAIGKCLAGRARDGVRSFSSGGVS